MSNESNNPQRFNLVTDAVLLKISANVWTGRSKDDVLSLATAQQNGATSDSVESYTVLLEKQDLAPLTTIANETRDWLNERFPVWDKNGFRIVVTSEYEKARQFLDGQKAKFLAIFEQSIAARRDELAAKAKARLGRLYRDGDGFPDVETLRRAFKFEIEQNVIPDSNDVRLNHVSPKVQAEIAAGVAAHNAAKVKDSVNQLLARLSSVVEHAAKTLADKDRVFRNSLVDNIRDIVELVPTLNLTNDPAINAIVREIKDKLTQHDADTLREDEGARESVANSAKSINDKLRALSGRV